MRATRALQADATVRYVIDAKASSLVVKAFSTGLLSAFGHDPQIAVRDFDGDASFSLDGPTLKDARLVLGIRADSLEVIDDISEADREDIHHKMDTEVLETGTFPEISYQSSRVTGSGSGDRYWVSLNGDLTLHGMTKALPISARVVLKGESLRATGEFSIRQSDYGIKPVSAAAGAIRVKDELRCTFDIVARKS